MAGHSRSKNGVLSHAYVPAITTYYRRNTKDVDARHKLALGPAEGRTRVAGHDARTKVTANYCYGVFLTNIVLILSNSSIFAPCLCMITLC